jgi:Resolvase, N terminal domain
MRERSGSRNLRCAIYARKSSEEGLEQDFNSLHAQREACEAYIVSQKQEGWKPVTDTYDDGGFSGGSMERPALQALLADIGAGRIDVVVVYKVDRLTRSLADFAKIVEVFDAHGVSFVGPRPDLTGGRNEGYHVHNYHGGLPDPARHGSRHSSGLRRHPSGLRGTLPNHHRYRPAKELRQPMFDFVLPRNAPCGPSL